MKILITALLASISLISIASAEPVWTHESEEGEDATSHHSYFYKSNGDSISHVRSVWNGGAQNPPLVTDYFIDGSTIRIRHSKGTREVVTKLTKGQDARLDIVNEYKIKGEHAGAMLLSPQPDKELNADKRRDLANLIYLLAKHRKPIK